MGDEADRHFEDMHDPENYFGEEEDGSDPVCPYCKMDAALVPGEQLFPHISRLRNHSFWRCWKCDAHVGCHEGTIRPLGSLANKELRDARVQAHAIFDPLWQTKKMTRSRAYSELAARLGTEKGKCHIGMFDVAMCRRVVDVARQIKLELNKAERRNGQ